ncbi:uncharacterized protein LOC135488912 [Lineus longissimus]|uniref:uncharacterized protein LOC135488912 n=1 Tax=Lineus longissimus TaxID=88925 RepID=UPI00315D3FA4
MVHLHNEDIEWLLQKIMNKDLSIAEMKKKAKELKGLQKVKRAFLIGVGKATWEEATSAFPEETKDELLSNWKDYSFSGGSVPESFSAFISRTMAVNTNDNVSKVNFLKLGKNDISPDVVSKASQLVICKASSTTLKNVSLATRAINVTHGCTLYRLLAMADTVEEALKAKDLLSGQNWTGIDLGFWYNPDVNKPQQIGQMRDKVTAFVVAYWTPNGKTNQDFTMIDIDNCWKLKSEAAFFDRVIQVFSCETDHVMSCFFSSNGNATLAARRQGREVTCIRETEMQLDDVRCILSVEE